MLKAKISCAKWCLKSYKCYLLCEKAEYQWVSIDLFFRESLLMWTSCKVFSIIQFYPKMNWALFYNCKASPTNGNRINHNDHIVLANIPLGFWWIASFSKWSSWPVGFSYNGLNHWPTYDLLKHCLGFFFSPWSKLVITKCN